MSRIRADLSVVACFEQVQQQYLITSMEDQNAHLLAAIRQHMNEDPNYKVLLLYFLKIALKGCVTASCARGC